MALTQESIFLGTVADDNTGDSLRDGGTKINNNFTDLFTFGSDFLALLGVSDGDTDLGTFTGTTITDSSSVKTALQELETAVESVSPLTWVQQTASFNAVAGNGYLIDTTGGGVAVTLPDITADGERIVLVDRGNAATNNITANADASDTVEGLASLTISLNHGYVELVADATGNQWIAQDESAGGGSVMTAATAGAAGTQGEAPQPAAGTQGLPLHGDASYKGVARDWAATTDYSASELAYVNVAGFEGLWRRNAAGTSTATFDATEAANWTFVAGPSRIPDWAASTAYSSGDVVAVDNAAYQGTFRRNAAGTSTAQFDATEVADWTCLNGQYIQSFVSGDWTGPVAGFRSITIAAATHAMGDTPGVQITAENAAGILVGLDQVQVTAGTGAITLVVTDGNEFDGSYKVRK